MAETTFIQTPEDASEALRAFQTAAMAGNGDLAYDTETTGLNVRSGLQDYGRTVQFSWRPWNRAVVFEMTEQWRPWIEGFFLAASDLVAHNAKFDAHVMTTYGIPVMERFLPFQLHDTAVLSRLFDERERPRLKELSVTYLRSDAADEQTKLKRLMTKHSWTWATVPVEHLVQYGGDDAALTGQLFDHFRGRIPYAEGAYRREQALLPVLFRMERNGLGVDRGLLDAVLKEEEDLSEAAAEVIGRLAPGVNLNSPKQLLEAFKARGVELSDTTAPTLLATDDDLARAIVTFRTHSKRLNTYARPWLDFITSAGRIHPSLNQMGTVTGRFSSDLPNFQNIPKGHGLRKCIVAAPGYQMVVADWNQMELRLYAHFANDEAMRSVFLSGGDIYQQVADLLGLSRQVGKMVMLASIYGAGPSRLASQVVAMAWKYGMGDLVPELQSLDWKGVHARFHAGYAIKDLARACENAAKARGQIGEAYITTLGGRRQRPKKVLLPAMKSGFRPSTLVFKDLANSLVQGSSSDLMKESLLAADAAGLGDYLRLTVHDEMVAEVPEAEVPEVSEAIRRIMTRPEFVPPLTAEVSVAATYGDAK
jgi:DNA polymerase-1